MHILSSLCVSGKCKFAKFVLVLKGYTSVPGKVIHPFHALTSCEKQNDRHFVLNGNADGMNKKFTRNADKIVLQNATGLHLSKCAYNFETLLLQ